MLTFAGKQFIRTAHQIMNYEKQLSRQMKDIANLKNGHITLEISQFRGKYFCLHKAYPRITVSIQGNQAAELEAGILSGDIDFSVEILPVKIMIWQAVLSAKNAICWCCLKNII